MNCPADTLAPGESFTCTATGFADDLQTGWSRGRLRRRRGRVSLVRPMRIWQRSRLMGEPQASWLRTTTRATTATRRPHRRVG